MYTEWIQHTHVCMLTVIPVRKLSGFSLKRRFQGRVQYVQARHIDYCSISLKHNMSPNYQSRSYFYIQHFQMCYFYDSCCYI